MEYKGYTAEISFDEKAEMLHGRVRHIRDVVTFEADSVEGLRREFRKSVDDYLEFCADLGLEPERAFSGRFLLRLDPGLHRDAVAAAESQGTSLNAWVTDAVREHLGAASLTQSGQRLGLS
jgi:predicted HicB family RNase H-like nuclease